MGRPRGAPNKTRRVVNVAGKLEQMGINVVEEIVACIGRLESDADKIKAWQDLLRYCAPIPKPAEPPLPRLRVLDVTALTSDELLRLAEGEK